MDPWQNVVHIEYRESFNESREHFVQMNFVVVEVGALVGEDFRDVVLAVLSTDFGWVKGDYRARST